MLIATPILEALSNPTSTLSKHYAGKKIDNLLQESCSFLTGVASDFRDQYEYLDTQPPAFQDLVEYTWHLKDLARDQSLTDVELEFSSEGQKYIKLLENFEAYVKAPADPANQAHFTALFAELKAQWSAVVELFEKAKANATPATTPTVTPPSIN
jgi:hypothetical protein